MIRLFALVAALIVLTPAAAAPQLPAGVDPQNTIVIDTNHGRIVIKLRADLAPKHAERIKTLAREKYYDNVPFHRVIEGFMAQTGDGREATAPAARNIRTCKPNSPTAVQARRGRHGARATTRTRPIRSSSSCMPTAHSSTANIRSWARSSPAWSRRQDQEGRAGRGPRPDGAACRSAPMSNDET